MDRLAFLKLFALGLGSSSQNSIKATKVTRRCKAVNEVICPLGHCQPQESIDEMDTFWLHRNPVQNGPIASATRVISCDVCGVLFELTPGYNPPNVTP